MGYLSETIYKFDSHIGDWVCYRVHAMLGLVVEIAMPHLGLSIADVPQVGIYQPENGATNG